MGTTFSNLTQVVANEDQQLHMSYLVDMPLGDEFAAQHRISSVYNPPKKNKISVAYFNCKYTSLFDVEKNLTAKAFSHSHKGRLL